ncbi:MAG: helix-turn-helix domain-containing protein, partial [Muribaculaceae bacterium]|nr:helix-turn-helix domain-containing protein [Muribaculaceae bacterium]
GNTIIGNSVGEVAIISEDGRALKKAVIPGGMAITSLAITDDDTAILGVIGSGVWELNLKNGNLIKKIDIPEKYMSVEVCVANDKTLYIGLYGKGLLKYDEKTGETTWISPDSKDIGFISPFITTIKRYGDSIWIGSYGGMACYNTSTGKFEDIDQSPYMACAVFDIVQENNNFVLIGTSNGLIRYNKDTKETKIYTTINGLSDNEVRSIAIDCKGRRWIGTMSGINCWHPEDGSIIAYTGGNGMVERTFINMAYSDVNDMIYASGRLGLTSFTPDSITVPGFDNPLKVSSIYLKGKKFIPEGTHGFPDVIHLSHNENSLAIRISPMDFRDTSNLKYLWRFVGDNDWEILPDGSDIINLSSLAPGNYTLEFKAEETGVESPVSVINLDVAYPWYQTWIAKTIYVLLILLMLLLAATLIRKRRQERINEQKMQFFMDMSHDMRSPLTLILGPLESLLKEKLKSDVRTRIRGVYRNAHRILNIVNQLLDLKKIDYGKKSLECRKTDISQFIAAIVEMFQPQAKDKGIILSFDSRMKVNHVWIDRSVVDRILVNLISNAIKYTPENGKVDVLLSESHINRIGNCIKISVLDNGIGVDSDSRSKIFSRYFRSGNGVEYSLDGFGIGLDICRRYVKLHHGEIYLDNRNDGKCGSVFNILLPIDKDIYGSEELMTDNQDYVSDAMSEGVLDSSAVKGMSKRRRNIYAECKVLVIEDDKHLLENICDFFKKYYNVYSAIDGVEGYQLAQEINPDVIITDVRMPRSDGLHLLRQIKFNASTKHIPVVILSSKSELSDRMAGWQQGAEAYIGKPFDFNELKAIVYNLIDGRKKLERKAPVSEDPKLNARQSSLNLKGNDETLMERINKILDEKIENEDMNVDRLAEELGVSRTHLYRRLKERYGINPSDYIRNKRLQRACELLKNDDLDITQIAYALGFSSQSQFSTTFKQFMGYTPTEFRSKHTEDAKSEMEFKS